MKSAEVKCFALADITKCQYYVTLRIQSRREVAKGRNRCAYYTVLTFLEGVCVWSLDDRVIALIDPLIAKPNRKFFENGTNLMHVRL